MDEARFGLINEPRKCWVKGERPTVICQTAQEYTYAFAAANPVNGDMLSLILPYTNTTTMNIFLEELSIRQSDRSMSIKGLEKNLVFTGFTNTFL